MPATILQQEDSRLGCNPQNKAESNSVKAKKTTLL